MHKMSAGGIGQFVLKNDTAMIQRPETESAPRWM